MQTIKVITYPTLKLIIASTDIPGYEELYKITSDAQVISLPKKIRKSTIILKSNTDKYGYLYVDLYKNEQKQKIKIHTLMALTFIGKRPYRFTINHIDHNKQNNNISNLEYITIRENCTHYLLNQKKSSQYIGVYWCKVQKKWVTYIRIKKIKHYLGSFDKEIKAHNKYQACLHAHNNNESIKQFVIKRKLGGVYFHKKSKKYIANITHDNKRIYIGGFKIKQQAIEVLNKYKQEHNIV